jgi:predicted metal-dependent enzyme (double-stranded beta helix superfamily)
VFDVDSLVASCVDVLGEAEPRAAVRQILTRALERPDEVAAAIGKSEGGLEVLYGSVELTILNVVWAPRMSIYPHDHRMWAAIGDAEQQRNRLRLRPDDRRETRRSVPR